MASYPPSQKVCFLSYPHGSGRECTRVKHRGRLKPEWSSLDEYLKMAFVPPDCQVMSLWYPRIQGLKLASSSGISDGFIVGTLGNYLSVVSRVAEDHL